MHSAVLFEILLLWNRNECRKEMWKILRANATCVVSNLTHPVRCTVIASVAFTIRRTVPCFNSVNSSTPNCSLPNPHECDLQFDMGQSSRWQISPPNAECLVRMVGSIIMWRVCNPYYCSSAATCCFLWQCQRRRHRIDSFIVFVFLVLCVT